MRPYLPRVASLICIALALSVSLSGQSRGTAGNKIFGFTSLHRIHLSLSASEWSVLQTSAARNSGGVPGGSDYQLPDGRMVHVGSGFAGYFPWTRADIRVGDASSKTEFKAAGLRYKGNSSFTRSSAAAPLLANFKLKLDHHGTKGTWDGEKTFNLQSGVTDPSRMREAIAYAIFRAAGVPAPRTTYADLTFTVPGIYENTPAGLFTIIEDVNKTFLARVLPPGNGLLMKPEGLRGGVQDLGNDWNVYIQRYRPDRAATPHEQQRVMEFGRLVSQHDVETFRSKIGTYLDVEQFLRFVAVNALIANTDSYLGGSHNYYIYLDPKDDKFRFIPWDQDLSMNGRFGLGEFTIIQRPAGATGNAVVQFGNVNVNPTTINGSGGPNVLQPATSNNPLIYWLLDDPAVAARYREILREIVSTVFNAAELTKLVDAVEGVGSGRGPSPRPFLEARAAHLQQLIGGWK